MDRALLPRPPVPPLFDARPRPARLPGTEARRLFSEQHEPRIRGVLARRGPSLRGADLLDRHDLGTGWNFVRDQGLNGLEAAGTAKDSFLGHFGLSRGTLSGVYLAGKLAAGLSRAWIEEDRRALPLETAAEIGEGDPMLAGWIRRLLYEQGPKLRWLRPHKTMRRVVGRLAEHLRRWPEEGPAPTRDDVLLWIDLIGRDRPLPVATRPRVDERKIPREAEALPDEAASDLSGFALAGFARRLEELQRQQARQAQQHEQMFIRLSSTIASLAAAVAGQGRAVDAPPAGGAGRPEAVSGGPDELSGDPEDLSGPRAAGRARRPAERAPGAAAPAAASGGPEDLSGGPEDLSGGPEDLSGGPDDLPRGPDDLPRGPDAARRPRLDCPYLLSEDDDALPVHDPGFPLSDFELLTCELIIAAAEASRQAGLLLDGRAEPGGAIATLLQLRADRAAARFHAHCEALRPLIKEGAAEGLRCLQAQAGGAGARPLPVYTDYPSGTPPGFHPIAWVVVLERDPLDDPQPLRLEPVVWRLLGVLEALHPRLARWLELRAAGAVSDCTLLYQLDRVLQAAYDRLYRVRAAFGEGAAEGLLIEQACGCTVALLEVPAATPEEPGLVTLGSDERVPALAKLGLDRQGRHLGLSLFTSQLVLALGGRGWGKSHLGRLIAECLHLHLPGVNRLPHPLRSATFEVDYNLGTGRRQMLRGFCPNTDAQQLAQLSAYYSSKASNAAFRKGVLRCLPQSLGPLRAELAAYRERGLHIEPLELGPQNLGQLGWEAILGAALQRGADRPLYAEHLAALIGTHGDQLMPETLLGEIQRSRELSRVRGGLENQLQPLRGLVRRGAELRGDLGLQCPVFYLLECQHSPESFLLGLLVAVMHGLCQPTGRPEDEIMLWLFCDELSKLADLPVVGRLLLAMAKELRHRKVSLFLGGQTATNLPPDLLGLVSVFFLFHLSSAAGFRPLQELEYFRDVSYEQVRMLLRGQALVGAVHSTDPQLRQVAQWMWLRPTFIDAGGESLTL